jgi:hypothetical protein
VERFAKYFPSFSGFVNGWNYYDAVYYLAYAAFAGSPGGRRAPLTSAVLQAGFDRLLEGEKVEIGPANIESAVKALSTSESITFVGVLGPAAFQPWDGAPTAGGTAVFCLTREESAVTYHYNVLVYNQDDGELEAGSGAPCSELLAQADR